MFSSIIVGIVVFLFLSWKPWIHLGKCVVSWLTDQELPVPDYKVFLKPKVEGTICFSCNYIFASFLFALFFALLWALVWPVMILVGIGVGGLYLTRILFRIRRTLKILGSVSHEHENGAVVNKKINSNILQKERWED